MMKRGVVLSFGLLAGACASEPVELGRVTVRLGHGDGTFGEPAEYEPPLHPRAVALHDLDLDGHLDLAAVGHSEEVAVLMRGRGDGTLEPWQEVRLSGAASGLVIEDLNRDGSPDLAVASDGRVEVCLARSPGRFETCEAYEGGSGYSIVAADFGGDGHTDLAVVSYYGSVVLVLDGHGDGTFAAGHVIAAVDHPYSLAVGDFNADGRPDIVTANLAAWDGRTISIILSNELGYETPVHHDVATGPLFVGVADLDGGPVDVVVSTAQDGVRVLSGAGDGSFSSMEEWTTSPSFALALADFDQDGAADVGVSSINREHVHVLRGDGAGGYEWPAGPILAPLASALASGDLDADGFPDLVLADSAGYPFF